MVSQQCKSKSWVESTAEEMDLSMDENLLEEVSTTTNTNTAITAAATTADDDDDDVF